MVLRRKKPGKCQVCGGPDPGTNGLCASCSGSTQASSAARRVAEKVRDRLASGEERGGFVCPVCRAELSWENIKTSEVEVTIYVREKIYYCPGCRSFLGVSSWHTEG
jgi:hypothetical protein